MIISTHLELTPRNKDIIDRLNDHLEESFGYFDKSQIVGIFLQGSQNYNLDLPGSEIHALSTIPSHQRHC